MKDKDILRDNQKNCEQTNIEKYSAVLIEHYACSQDCLAIRKNNKFVSCGKIWCGNCYFYPSNYPNNFGDCEVNRKHWLSDKATDIEIKTDYEYDEIEDW